MITLKPAAMIGKGLHRECFIHPEDINKCIKVVVYGNQQETDREQSYYHFLKKQKIAWDMLPKFYGNIDTNMGLGAVFDLIRDHNGQISNSLEHFLKDKEFVSNNRQSLLKALNNLKAYLLTYNIITMPIKSKNVLYQRTSDSNGVLHVIDNIGNADFIPLATYSSFWGNKKILRRWNRFYNALDL
jgi:PhoP regulatory network protein YrbL